MRIRAFPLHQNLVSRCFSKPPMHFSIISLYVIMMQVWWAGPIQSNPWPKFQPQKGDLPDSFAQIKRDSLTT